MAPADQNSLIIKGGDLFLQVGPDKTPFRIHSHFLVRESGWWRKELIGDEAESSGDAPLRKGTGPNSPYSLRDVMPGDFRLFLGVFYNSAYGDYSHVTTPQWMLILRYTHAWGFKEVEKLAVRCLENQQMDIAERIVLYQRSKVSNKYLLPHYITLVSRSEGLELEECRVLGYKNLWFLQHARDELYAKVQSSTSTGGFQDIDRAEIGNIIRTVYPRIVGNMDLAPGSSTTTNDKDKSECRVEDAEVEDERGRSDTGSWEDMTEDEDEEWDTLAVPGSFSPT